MKRSEFLGRSAMLLAGGVALGGAARASGGGKEPSPEALGVLVDTTLCIGCRLCELACDRQHGLTDPPAPEEALKDESVFSKRRFLAPTRYTVVNRYPGKEGAAKPVFVKTQCMHCAHAPCVSACIVGALEKLPSGVVRYDYDKCIGCRYCQVACPFQVPSYEFSEAFTPRVMKCTLCLERISREGGLPACVQACPVGVMTFGKRAELLELARKRMSRKPGRYVDHIYGEHDAGGTTWMYLAEQPFEKLGFPKLSDRSPAELSETIMHAAFWHWIPPFTLLGILGATMHLCKPSEGKAHEKSGRRPPGEPEAKGPEGEPEGRGQG